MHSPRIWIAVAAFLVFCASFASFARSAEAHANLVRSEPASGGRVDAMPQRLRLEYTEGVMSLEVRVTDSGGAHFEVGRATADLADRRIQAVTLREAPPAIYTVTWQALSVDGHTTDGSFFFLVGTDVPDRATVLALVADAAAHGPSGPHPIDVIAKTLLFVSVSVLAGLPLAIATTARGLTGSARAWTTVRAGLRWAALALVAGATMLALKQFASGYQWRGSDALAYLSGGQGLAALARIAAAIVTLAALAVIDRPARALTIVFAIATTAQLSISLVSHSHTLLTGLWPLASDFAHLLGAGIWSGGLLLLAVILPMSWPDVTSDERRLHTAQVGRAFALLAIAGAAAVITAGLLLASWHLGDWTELLGVLYGQALLAKTTLLGVALALGAWHRLRLVHAMEVAGAAAVRRFTGSVRVEAAAVLAILMLSALMTSTETGTASAGANRGTSVRRTEHVRGIDVQLTMTPGTPGFNVFDVEYLRDGRPASDVGAPTLLLRLPSADVELDPVQLQPGDGGRYSAVAALTQPGEWFARVSGDVDGAFTAGRFTLPEARSGAGPYRGAPSLVLATRIGAALIALAGGAGIVLETVARRRHDRGAAPAASSDAKGRHI